MEWKNLYHLLLPLSLLLSNSSAAQTGKDYKIMLKSGAFTPDRNISVRNQGNTLRYNAPDKRMFVIIQFDEIPDEAARKKLKEEGIELLQYIPNYAFTATVTGNGYGNALARTKGRSIISLSAAQKMQPGLATGRIPAHALKTPGMADVLISYPKSFTPEEIRKDLKEDGFEIIDEQYKNYQVLTLRVPLTQLNALAEKPYIQYVQAIPGEDKPFNNKSAANARANVLGSNIGRNLTGAGVVVGVGDESNPLQHVDFNNRIINRTAIETGAHGIHVMGTLGGAGIMNERFSGYAPKATIVAQSYSSILAYSPQYYRDFGMVITNNSYGEDVNTCETYGYYDLYSSILDQQAFEMPHLQHVFAAGNSGAISCSPYPAGFSNILSGYQTAKNVLTVGNANETGVIVNGSSKGPTRDGRIKPDITAQGQTVMSTIPVNLYGGGAGTSMSAPAVAGGLALLYERYRQLFSNETPKNGLMKALVLNGATDKGNNGPDYKYGFGWLNLLRSVTMLESKSFVNDSLAHNETREISIPVPSGTAQLKVMLYWNDPAAPVLSTQNLVHNLDLKVINPKSATILPLLLDSTPSKVNNVASTGVDDINNMEQVVINNPGEGSYKIQVKGTSIAQNPRQEYFVVYDVIPNSLSLTYPVGNERLRDGDAFQIGWDAFGDVTSTFTVQYSSNDGQSWTNIGNNLAAGLRQFSWTIPTGTIAEKAKIKVIQNSTGAESVSEAFTIVGIPTVTLSALQCEGYISLDWTAVNGATDYEVMILKGNDMVPAGTTQATSFILAGMLKDSTYYVSVRARINGKAGRRAVAISRRPDSGTCQGNISNHDFKIEAILTPAGSGRKNTSTQLGSDVFVKIRIKNLDDVDLNEPIDVGFELNGSRVPIETITPFIEKGKTYDHTFPVVANLSHPGDYTIKVYIHHAGDPVSANDTLTKTFRQLNNDALTLPFLDDMEYLPVQTIVKNQVGLTGDGRYDFSASTDAGRVRTFVNSGFAFSGQKTLTLDANRYFSGGNTNYLDATFNLSNYDVNDSDIRLNFQYKNHGQKINSNNKVWIRGRDTDPWIEVYDLFTNQNTAQDSYKQPKGIEVSSLLSVNGKNFSSSFQVRFGQWGKMIAADYSNGAGYSFDDIEIYTVADDIQLLGLVTPAAESCGLGSEEPVTIRVRNSSARGISKIPICFSLPNGVVIKDTIPSIAKRTTIDYTFTPKADLSALGPQVIKAWSALVTDTYPDNDTLLLPLYNAPLITQFPYLEDFENGDGYWFAKGTKSSWQYGSPVSTGLNTSASGTKIWKTNLSGGHNDREESYLYSPCFNVAGLAVPTLSFSASIDLETCDPNPCDIAYVEYSGNGGAWTRLGNQGGGTNWYNKTYAGRGAWSIQDYTRWHVATIPLPAGFTTLKIRFVMISDGSTHREGVAIDDIHIYDKLNSIYDGTSTGAPVSQVIGGNSTWVHFSQNNQVLASVKSNGQNLGNTEVQAYIHSSAVRNTNNQYYLNRSYTVKPAQVNVADSVTLRFYLLDAESEALIRAEGCSGCGKPVHAYELGISKYRNADKSKEDGNIINNSDGNWSFHPASQLRIVPFDKGYYLEMKVKNFSEFWFSNAALGSTTALPVDLVSFDAKKVEGSEGESHALLEWVTASEEDFDHFDIEVAVGNEAYRLNQFQKLSEVAGIGGLSTKRHYTFMDKAPGKSGARYYRLKATDHDLTYTYSRVRPVIFNETAAWTVYPNPSQGLFYVNYQANTGNEVSVRIFDLNGRLFEENNSIATGFAQKSKVDLSGAGYPAGLYVLEIVTGKDKHAFQVLKD